MKLTPQAEIAASEIYHLIESGQANLSEGTPIGDIVQKAMDAGYRECYGRLMADKARLDWLELHFQEFDPLNGYIPYPCLDGALRAALDAAMQKP